MWFGSVLVVLLAMAGTGCVTPRQHVATGPIDWETVGDRWTVHLVTQDEDGDERRTRLWIAVVGGTGVLRTGETRWGKNLRRDLHGGLLVRGVEHRVDVEFVEEEEMQKKIHEAFREKYGWQDRLVGVMTSDRYFLRLLPQAADR